MDKQIKEALDSCTQGKWEWEIKSIEANKWGGYDVCDLVVKHDNVRSTSVITQVPNKYQCEVISVHKEADARLIANAPTWLTWQQSRIAELERQNAFLIDNGSRALETASEMIERLERQNMELLKALETIESIKYDNLSYSPEDAECMRGIAIETIKQVKGE
jgi:hypothetical protein